jgi:tetratricopeptide (TPR) repeat protein
MNILRKSTKGSLFFSEKALQTVEPDHPRRCRKLMRPLLAALAACSALVWAQTPAPWEQPLALQRWSEAEPLLQQALAGGDTAPVLRGLAAVYRATGRIRDAEPILERLVALDESAANLEDLARIKAGLGQLDRAETLYRRALQLRPGPNADPLGAIPTRQRLAKVLLAEEKYPQAEQEALTAISLRIRALGPQPPELPADYALLADVYEKQKHWDAAAGVWETVAGIQTTAFGYEDLRLADTLESQAACQRELKLVDQAESALRRTLAIRELNLGPASPEVAHSTDELAMLLFQTKRFADAEPFYLRSLDIYKSLLEPSNPLLARAYDNLAVTEAMLQKYDQAEPLYREALKLRDSEDALSLRNLALILVARGKPADADPLYSRALGILDAPNNENPDLLKQVLAEYSSVLHDLKRPVEAAKLDNRLKGAKPVPAAKRPPVAAKQ